MAKARFVVYNDARDEYRWRFRASNGEIIADSAEGYVRKTDCLAGIALVRKEAPDADLVDTTTK
jgi:uncharacterized protein YegP (UPF0339 family)